MDAYPRVVSRVLSPARAATHEKLIDATIRLATDGGYDAVTIRAVAAAAGTSVPTVYQHASSKDQLLTDALLRLGDDSNEQLRARPPHGTPAQRITAVFVRVLTTAAENPQLYHALSRAWVANAPALINSGGNDVFPSGSAAWIGETLRVGDTGTHSDAALESATRILSCLFLGALIEVSSGRDVDEVIEIMGDAAERLLPNAPQSD